MTESRMVMRGMSYFKPALLPLPKGANAPVFIKIDGEYAVMHSGKWVWANEGNAKSALKVHCHQQMRSLRTRYQEWGYSWGEADQAVRRVYDIWVRDHVEFTNVTPDYREGSE